MLAAVRRSGVQALWAPISRSLIARATPQPFKWQPSPRTAALPQIYRSLHVSFPVGAAEAAQAQTTDAEPVTPQRVTEFDDLAKQGLVSPKITNRITKFMKITTMTDVQSMTINETLQGDDVYVPLCLFVFVAIRLYVGMLTSFLVWPRLKPEPAKLWLSLFP